MKNLINCFDKLNLTHEQSACVEMINSFLNEESLSNIFILKGYAGTGKTTLVGGLINYLNINSRSFLALAPTGRAARVFSTKSNFEAKTLHSSIYQSSSTSLDLEKSEYSKKYCLKINAPSNGTIIVVDEASMLNDIESDNGSTIFGSGKLLTDLISFANFKSNPKTKIIFVGDTAQLPPIGNYSSPALDDKYFQTVFNLDTKICELTKVVRHDNGILEAATAIRESIQSNQLNGIMPKHNNEVSIIPNFSLLDAYVGNVKALDDLDKNIMIAGTNKQVFKLNMKVRDHFFNNQYADIHTGEKLIVVDNNYLQETSLMNGEFLKVVEIYGQEVIPVRVNTDGKEKLAEEEGHKRVDVNKIEVNLTFRDILVESTDGNRLKVKILESFLFKPEAGISKFVSRALFLMVFGKLKKRCPDLKGKEFNDKLAMELENDPYFNVLRVKFGYAITCHKAQGGEWENVFVNIWAKDVNTISHFRWVYTAITRASNHLYVESLEQHQPNSLRQRFLSDSWGQPTLLN